jgi:small-conductance mechanosensitive channel
LPEPAGNVLIVSVADSEVNLETSFWINDLQNGQKGLVSDLMFDICMRFRQEGVLLASQDSDGPKSISSKPVVA